MKTSTPISQIRATAAALALLGTLFWGGTASAAGTASGTIISNTVSLNYTVGTATTSVSASAVGFMVDNKVNLSVTETGGGVTVVTPNATARITTFTVTNLGNTAQGYTFVAANQVGGAAILGTLDGIDVTITDVFVDSNSNGIYDVGVDTATAILTLAPDASVTVFVLTNIPNTATNGQQANITLTATTTTDGTATAVVATATPNTATLDIVFADAATVELGFVGASAARDAQATARDAYRVVTALISMVKTSTLLCDPFNGTTSPTSIPGAMVRWTITISNAAGATASATLGLALDTLDTNTLFDPNLVGPTNAATCSSGTGVAQGAAGSGFRIDVLGTTRTAALGLNTRYFTSANDSDSAYFDGAAVRIDYGTALPAGAGTGATTYTAGELKPGESVTVYFNATIQ